MIVIVITIYLNQGIVMNHLALCILLATTSSVVTAENYSVETGISFTTKDYFDQDINASLLDATYYFNHIDDSKGPLAEAAFLNKSSELSLKYGYASQEFLENYTTWGLGGRYISDTGLIVAIDYTNKGITYITGEEHIIDSGYLEVGAYITDVSTLTLSYSSNQNDKIDEDGIISNTASIRYNHLFLMENDTSIKFNARYGYTTYRNDKYSDDDFDILDLSGDYYFNHQLSVGLDFMTFKTTHDEAAIKYGIKSSYFINNKVSFSGAWSLTDIEDISEDVTSFSIDVNARF
tara:strand:- start:356 stop:1231 length:876 start_codon:yes stop_codon:yes gene_type:complete